MPSLSPRQPSPGNAKKRTSRSSVKNQQRIKPKSPPYWRAFGLVRPNRLPKKTVSSRFMPNQRRPEDRHSRIPRSVASRRTRHKEGTTRLPILRLRVRAKRVAATKKEPATPHESEAAQRPERGRTPSGHVLRHRKTRPLNASHEPFLEHFQFEMLCISNHTACRFAEKARFFRSLLAGRRCAAASRFTFFKVETL